MSKEVTLSNIYHVYIPEDKLASMMRDYQESIDPNADSDDLYITAANGWANGQRTFIEGIGNLKENGVIIKHVDDDAEVDDP